MEPRREAQMEVPRVSLEKDSCLAAESIVRQASLLLDPLQVGVAGEGSCPARAAVLTTESVMQGIKARLSWQDSGFPFIATRP